MRNNSSAILNECTGAQLLMLAIANADLRPSVSRILDSRAKPGRRSTAITASRTTAGQTQLVLRRAG